MIGSGHFGQVDRGTWKSIKKDTVLDVALKTISSDSSAEDKIKLLQEAIIMGQFTHPNIVQLYGIVSRGDPVSLTEGVEGKLIYVPLLLAMYHMPIKNTAMLHIATLKITTFKEGEWQLFSCMPIASTYLVRINVVVEKEWSGPDPPQWIYYFSLFILITANTCYGVHA